MRSILVVLFFSFISSAEAHDPRYPIRGTLGNFLLRDFVRKGCGVQTRQIMAHLAPQAPGADTVLKGQRLTELYYGGHFLQSLGRVSGWESNCGESFQLAIGNPITSQSGPIFWSLGSLSKEILSGFPTHSISLDSTERSPTDPTSLRAVVTSSLLRSPTWVCQPNLQTAPNFFSSF